MLSIEGFALCWEVGLEGLDNARTSLKVESEVSIFVRTV